MTTGSSGVFLPSGNDPSNAFQASTPSVSSSSSHRDNANLRETGVDLVEAFAA